jgi:hypothetical protein
MEDLRIAYDRLRGPENRPFVVVFALLLVMTLLVGCLVLYQFFIAPRQTTPQLAAAPKALATNPVEPTPSGLTSIPTETATVSARLQVLKAPTAKVKRTARPKPTAGQGCIYSSPGLNQIFSPAPSGSWSPIEHYFCDNGYWVIGTLDVVDRKTGGWGQDGVAEKILIKYDSDGTIADRIFFDPQGEEFSGPKH